MSEQDYLTFLGYTPTTEWMVLKSEESKPLLEISGSQNNMYGASDPTGEKMFGKNAKIVKRSWYEKNTVSTKPESVSPPPPPAAKTGPEPVDIKVEEKIVCVLTSRLEVLKEKGLIIDDENQDVIFPTGKVSFINIKNYPKEVWEKVKNKDYTKEKIVLEEKEDTTYELSKDKRVEMLASLGLSQNGALYVDEANTTAIEILKVNTASDQDFMKSFEAMKGNLEAIAESEKEALAKKQKEIDKGEVIGKNKFNVETVSSDLKSTASIEEDTDTVIELHKPQKKEVPEIGEGNIITMKMILK